MNVRPLCFVLMPFGRKPDGGGRVIDFDAVYRELIAPAITAAGMQPIRADEERTGGVIHKPMYERLILCEYAVADLTTANANVYYELGIRHAVRPASTVLIFASDTRLPFDVGPLRGMPYGLNAGGTPAGAASDATGLAALLTAARENATDSPLFQLLDGMQPMDVSHLKTDVFRDQVDYSATVKERLADARDEGVAAVQAIADELGDARDIEAGIVIDLLLSYRAVSAWSQMVALVDAVDEPLGRTAIVREQYAFALNRAGESEHAERVLLEVVGDHGASGETMGLLGRVYKDRFEAARDASQALLARGLLKKAIEAYMQGFESDWRDFYPGVNAVTLMELSEPPDPRRTSLIPVVEYGVRRKLAMGEAGYWDYATLLELAVLAGNQEAASDALADTLAAVNERWEPESTIRNVRLIREAREARGEPAAWLSEVESALTAAALAQPAG
ncbi:MAG: TRAFs-binding domain-containing protein [Chloroflexi bacterium]|nr:TRAFs-binding domain-containing protein [Chloroflexota bacterium]